MRHVKLLRLILYPIAEYFYLFDILLAFIIIATIAVIAMVLNGTADPVVMWKAVGTSLGMLFIRERLKVIFGR